MKSHFVILGIGIVLGLVGCKAEGDPHLLYNEGVKAWLDGEQARGLYLVKKAYLLEPRQEIRVAYQKMRVELKKASFGENVVVGMSGANRLAWLGIWLFVGGAGLIIVKRGEWENNILKRIQEWPFLWSLILAVYLVGGSCLVFQAFVGWRMFFPESAVIVENTSLLDRPEEGGLSIVQVSAGEEGWILRRNQGYVLFRSEGGQEGWVLTNQCWGVWQ
ncbi:SH3 domain-containing protein [Thermospira aquatica]|uniref:SH3 domain-containing protein n=1 Tax=Thermospira aquatica TaxID=2828656 RepID=A0AAX3BB59_9SPIR|nr:hypothetical protein [Thermospira aquatica]URA09330.1 hypothetical protein KDW03_07495 [Thermospira aquatica]